MDGPFYKTKYFQIASLLAGVEYGKSVFVESQGWAIFGRLGNDLQKAQLLPSLNSDWKEGPPLISDLRAHKQGQCIFQVFFKFKFCIKTASKCCSQVLLKFVIKCTGLIKFIQFTFRFQILKQDFYMMSMQIQMNPITITTTMTGEDEGFQPFWIGQLCHFLNKS